MTKYKFLFWAPLSNFEAERQPIELATNLHITVASQYEKQLLSELKAKWTNIRFSDFLLRLTLDKEEPEQAPNIYLSEARTQVVKAVSLFRLFRSQPIGFNVIVQQYSNDVSYAYSANAFLHYMLWANTDSKLSTEIYRLNKQEIKEFTSFFLAHDLPAIPKINLAIDYFNKSYIEPYTPRDSFLDIIICLENLFLKGTERELSYKLSMRMAHLLGENVEERDKVFQFIKAAYSRRSKIVHGSDVKTPSEDDLFRIRDLARRSIRYLLQNIGLWSGAEQDKIILGDTFYPNHLMEQTL